MDASDTAELSPLWREMLPEIVFHHIIPYVCAALEKELYLSDAPCHVVRARLQSIVQLRTLLSPRVPKLVPSTEAVLMPLVVRHVARIRRAFRSGDCVSEDFPNNCAAFLDALNRGDKVPETTCLCPAALISHVLTIVPQVTSFAMGASTCKVVELLDGEGYYHLYPPKPFFEVYSGMGRRLLVCVLDTAKED